MMHMLGLHNRKYFSLSTFRIFRLQILLLILLIFVSFSLLQDQKRGHCIVHACSSTGASILMFVRINNPNNKSNWLISGKESISIPPPHHNHVNVIFRSTDNSKKFHTCLGAKRKKKNNVDSSTKRISSLSSSSSLNNTKITASTNNISIAANRPIASVGGVTEKHNYEQFFYSEKSTKDIYQLAKLYSYPLFLCNPSLALLANEDKVPYLLLDRDRRFQFLRKFKEFSLTEPFLISSFSYDVIFIDPPFANITPNQLVKCIRMMAPNRDKLNVPIYIAYNAKREEDLLSAFDNLPCPKLEKLWRLEYRSVRDDMQIYLYGPQQVHN